MRKFFSHYPHYLKMNFSFGRGKLRFVSSTGVTTNLFILETIKGIYEYEDGSTERSSGKTYYNYNRINISPMISAGIDWEMENQKHLKIEPTFRYGIIQVIDAPVTDYLWNAGLSIGYYFGVR